MSNKVLDFQIVTDAEAEPVTLEEAKAWMGVDYSEKDAIITSLITAARHLLERTYDIGIVQKDIKLVVDNSSGGIDIPGAPISDLVAKDRSGMVVTLFTTGSYYTFIDAPCTNYLELECKSGYVIGEVPDVYKTVVKQQVLHMFENLGDQNGEVGICTEAASIMAAYKQNSFGFWI